MLKNGTSVEDMEDITMSSSYSLIRGNMTTSDGLYSTSVSLLISSLSYYDTANYSCLGSNNLASVQERQTTPAAYIVQCKCVLLLYTVYSLLLFYH